MATFTRSASCIRLPSIAVLLLGLTSADRVRAQPTDPAAASPPQLPASVRAEAALPEASPGATATPPPPAAGPPWGYRAPPPAGNLPRYYPGYGYAPPLGPPPPPPPAPPRYNSVPMMVAGISLISLGAVGVVTGLAVLQAAEDQDCTSFPCDTTDRDQQLAGGSVAGVGLAALGAGIVMTIVGGLRVPAQDTSSPAPNPALPRLALAPNRAQLRWIW